MTTEKEDVKCPWCGTVQPVAEFKVNTKDHGHGAITERRCGRCGKVMAAYLESEGSFLPR
ncbi:MAG: hypothetical protein AB1603_00595 [Chloroflexota bacterium]